MSHTFVVAALWLALATSPPAVAKGPEPITDADAQAIYAVLLPPMWARSGSKDVLLLQRETVKPYACRVKNTSYDPEWDAIENSFAQANEQAQILDGALRLGVPYRFIGQSTIAAENARLERNYPGWQGKQGATQYAAASAVTFNRQRTRAMVYVRLRDEGEVQSMEKRDGRWVRAPRDVCSWMA